MNDADAIRHTLARWSQLNDDKDAQAWTDLHTQDARVVGGNNTAQVGRTTILEFISAIYAAEPERGSCHFCGNSIISIDGDEAEVHTDVLVALRAGDGTWKVSHVNHLTDRMVRQGDAWLFAERRTQPRSALVGELAEASGNPAPTDSEAVRRVLARYCFLLDNRNALAWAGLFTDDARLVTGDEELRGRAALLAMLERQFAAAAPESCSEHLTTNIVETIDGDVADVTSDLLALERMGPEPWQALSIRRVHDRLVREAATWRIAERVFTP